MALCRALPTANQLTKKQLLCALARWPARAAVAALRRELSAGSDPSLRAQALHTLVACAASADDLRSAPSLVSGAHYLLLLEIYKPLLR